MESERTAVPKFYLIIRSPLDLCHNAMTKDTPILYRRNSRQQKNEEVRSEINVPLTNSLIIQFTLSNFVQTKNSKCRSTSHQYSGTGTYGKVISKSLLISFTFTIHRISECSVRSLMNKITKFEWGHRSNQFSVKK